MEENENFKWIGIAEKVADKVLEYKDKDDKLMEIIQKIKGLEKVGGKPEKKNDGELVKNTDGFSAMNMIFARGRNGETQYEFVKNFEKGTNMEEDSYMEQDGIPQINFQAVRIVSGSKDEEDLKQALWELFEISLKYADDKSQENRKIFVDRYNNVFSIEKKKNSKIKTNFTKSLSVALYISRPYVYIPLDRYTQKIIKNVSKVDIDVDNIENGEEYLKLIDEVNAYIEENKTKDLPYTNIPELSAYAFKTLHNEKITYYAGGCRYNDDNSNQGGKIFFEKGIFAIGWAKLGNLKQYKTEEELKGAAIKINEKVSMTSIRNFASLKKGDIIVLKSSSNRGKNRSEAFSRIFGIGEVLDDFDDGYKLDKEIGHTIPVDWYVKYDNPIDIGGLSLRSTLEKLVGKNMEKLSKVINLETGEIKNDTLLDVDNKKEENENINIKEKGRNILVYGVPGSGKSYYIKEKLEGISEKQKERVIFYPEYSYYDFVGQNVPGEDGKLVFAPGPFTKILEKALKKENENKNYYLIIEEMNRGNAEAIFGDILQLLDRNKDGKSEYGITNDVVLNYLKDKDCEVEEKLYIPSNLTIYATINNADQNVFSLDTAFSRRWEYEIKTCDSAEDIGKGESKKYFVSGVKGIDEVEGENKYTWNEIRKAINNEILNNKEEIYNAEDKRLGLYYIDEDCLKEGSKQNYSEEEKKEYRKKFANKIFRYLWLDVFKNNRGLIFNENFRSLEDVIAKFENDGKIGDILKINLDNAEN